MPRKLATTLILVVTSSLVLASSAFAVRPAESLSGSGTGSATGTSGGFPWVDVAVGVALAVVGIVCLAAVVVVSRNRRHSAALQS